MVDAEDTPQKCVDEAAVRHDDDRLAVVGRRKSIQDPKDAGAQSSFIFKTRESPRAGSATRESLLGVVAVSPSIGPNARSTKSSSTRGSSCR